MSPNTGWGADVKGAADNTGFSYVKLEAPKGRVNVALLQGNRTCVWNSDPGWREAIQKPQVDRDGLLDSEGQGYSKEAGRGIVLNIAFEGSL